MNDLSSRIANLSPEQRKTLEERLKEKKITILDEIGVLKKEAFTAIQPAVKSEYYPLSSAQKRLYILNQFEETGTSYNITNCSLIEGELDRERVEAVFAELVKRHESLRTSFELMNGEPVQRIWPAPDPVSEAERPFGFRIEYWDQVEESSIPEIIRGFIRPFDLEKIPLVRAGVLKIGPAKYLFIYDMHHIISDGTSMGILIREFMDLYEGQQLSPLRIRYKDFALWQNQLFRGGAVKNQEEFWLKSFGDELPVLNLPGDYTRPALQSFEGGRIEFEMGVEVSQAIHQIAAASGATVYMVLLAAFNILLAKYSGQEDIVIGSPIAGRRHVDLEKIIGMFVNTLAMRNYPSRDKAFMEFLREVKENSLLAFENQDYQFEELVEKLNIQRDLSRNPLFDVMFVLQNTDQGGRVSRDLKFSPYPLDNQTTKFDLLLNAVETAEGFAFDLEYCAKIFKPETIWRLISHFQGIVTQIAANPQQKIAAIEMLTSTEKNLILDQFNATAREFGPSKTIQTLFEEQVEKTPDDIALTFEGQRLTYRELNRKANQLGRLLRKKGVKPGSLVAIMASRSLETVIGIMAILKAGGGFVPVDPEYPGERIDYIIQDSRTDLLLARDQLAHPMRFSGTIIELGSGNQAVACEDDSNLELMGLPSDLLYLIYTSGTTGQPKGVMLEHRNLVNLIRFEYAGTGIPFHGKVLQFATFSFDVCYQEIFSTLLAGGELYLITQELRHDTGKLFEFISRHQIPVVFLPTAYLKFLMKETEYLKLFPACVRQIIVAGEQLLISEEMKQYLKTNRIFLHNHYGPSETHVVTTKTLDPDDEIPSLPSIGTPIANVRIYILDQSQNLQPVGVPGEIYISGANTGRGYWGHPELTAAKFLPDPFYPEERMYRTGDLGRWTPDGDIEFLGRIDHQVKIRGYRIELGEIEARLLDHESIKEAIVTVRDDEGGAGKYLCAYLTSEKELTIPELRAYLAKYLPEYMVPSYFLLLDQMPLTPNGKINRLALPAPAGNIDSGVGYLAPRSDSEMKLAHIWQNVLKAERVGVNDEFFVLGGDSLKALKLVAEAARENIKINITDIFKYKTIAKILENSNTGAAQNEPKRKPVEIIRIEDRWAGNREFQIDTSDSKELKIELQREINVYLHRALPLCIVLADSNLYPWFMERFINIFGAVDNQGYLTLDYLEVHAPYRDVIGEIALGVKQLEHVTDIIRFITEHIDLGYYLNIAVDEFYLPGKTRYQNTHYVHHSLVYGYDHREQKVKAIGFDSGGIFTELSFGYQEFTEAYDRGKLYYRESAPWAFKTAAQLFYHNGWEGPHPFDIQRFLNELGNYLFSVDNDSLTYYWRLKKEQVTYGFAVYQTVIWHLKNLLAGQLTIDYRAIHLLAEHCRGLAKRLEFIMDRYSLGGKLPELYAGFLKVVERLNELRLQFFDLQHDITPDDIAGPESKLAAIVNQYIESLSAAKEKERVVLLEIYAELKAGFPGPLSPQPEAQAEIVAGEDSR